MADDPRDTAEWLRARKQAKLRDQYRCQYCRMHEGEWHGIDLQVHHIRPVDSGGSNDLDNLVTLCNGCHWTLHRHYDDKDQLTVDLLDEDRPTLGLPSSRRDSFDFNECEEQIVELLKSNGPTQLKEIIEYTDYSRGYVQTSLDGLKLGGYTCRISRGVYAYITELEFWRLEGREKDEHGRKRVSVWDPGEQTDLQRYGPKEHD